MRRAWGINNKTLPLRVCLHRGTPTNVELKCAPLVLFCKHLLSACSGAPSPAEPSGLRPTHAAPRQSVWHAGSRHCSCTSSCLLTSIQLSRCGRMPQHLPNPFCTGGGRHQGPTAAAAPAAASAGRRNLSSEPQRCRELQQHPCKDVAGAALLQQLDVRQPVQQGLERKPL